MIEGNESVLFVFLDDCDLIVFVWLSCLYLGFVCECVCMDLVQFDVVDVVFVQDLCDGLYVVVVGDYVFGCNL